MNETILKALAEQVVETLEGDDRLMEIFHETIDAVFDANSIDCSTDVGMDAMMDVAQRICIRTF